MICNRSENLSKKPRISVLKINLKEIHGKKKLFNRTYNIILSDDMVLTRA
jgi:hypothetical protein